MDIYNKLIDFIEFIVIPRLPFLERNLMKFDQYFNIPKRLLIQIFVFVFIWSLTTSLFTLMTSYMIFCLYPAYQTLRLINGKKVKNKSELMHWLNYWSIYAAFISPIEHYFQNILNSIPFINILRLIFGFWLYSTHFNGAQIIMKQYIIPIYRQINLESIDQLGSHAIDCLIEYSNKNDKKRYKKREKNVLVEQSRKQLRQNRQIQETKRIKINDSSSTSSASLHSLCLD